MLFLSSPRDSFVSGSVFNIRGGVGSQHQQTHREKEVPQIPSKEYFLQSPFLHTSAIQRGKVEEQSPSTETQTEGKKDKLKKILSEIILDKIGDNFNKKTVSTRGLISLLSFLSVVEAEAEVESPRVPRPMSSYQTEFRDKTSGQGSGLKEKPYFDTVDVVVGGITVDREKDR